MHNNNLKTGGIFHFVGKLLVLLSFLLLVPLAVVFIYWGQYTDGWKTIVAFFIPAALSFILGYALQKRFKYHPLDTTGAMVMCALGWLAVSAMGGIPFVISIDASYLDGYFEAMSGFTTTGITVFDGLDTMPRSIIFWRAFTQWLGGIGILSFFLAIMFQMSAHHLFSAESHKIISGRPTPGVFHSVRWLWGAYSLLTVLSIVALSLEGMSVFDSVCHTFTALSTGGFSPYDASISYYMLSGHPHYKLIEYTLTAMMLLGGITILVHIRLLKLDIKALWDNIEIRDWWKLLALFVAVIMLDHWLKVSWDVSFEELFRKTAFQVVSILTTTGFATEDIAGPFFPALSKQLFLVMMVIGGCVGSTGGGIKVMRIAILTRLMGRQLFKTRVSTRASSSLVIDNRIVPKEEVDRVAALFFTWMAFLVIGGGITALFSSLGPWESLSGMFSAVGNIGPCYISPKDMITIHPVVKVTYIIGMLAGRLEILPVLLLFTPRSWR